MSVITKPAMVMTVDGARFVWHGGEYIEVKPLDGGGVSVDIINVWDYAEGAPRIERSLEAFERAVLAYVVENLNI